VQVVRRGEGAPQWAAHDTDLLFTFVMHGEVTLEGEGRDPYRLSAGDAFVIPPHMKTRLSEPSADVELLEVSLPGAFATTLG
jgi:quercetin dioxygenase-like cupin family protein